MRVDHAADTILELGNHFAAAVVRGRVRGEEEPDVDVEANGIAADLHVALFENVKQADLHELIELGQLVDRKNAAMHAGNEPKMQGFLGRHAHAAGELGGVDFADDVRK